MDTLELLDQQLLQNNLHLQKCSFFLPHIGKNYNDSTTKVFIIGESHYLPGGLNKNVNAQGWYNYDPSVRDLIKGSYGHMNTRQVMSRYRTNKTLKAFRIFYNLEMAYQTVLNDKALFDTCVFFNYFQRPAEETGKSITVTHKDNQIAYSNLEIAIAVLKPEVVLFASNKAYNSFKSIYKQQHPSVLFDVIPHPASAWWYRDSWRYSFKGVKGNGRDKFIRILNRFHKEV